MEVEDFLDDVRPERDCVDNVISKPNYKIPTDEVDGVDLVAVTENEFMEVEHLHPVGESKNIVMFNTNDEINASKIEDVDSITATRNEFMDVEDFHMDVHLIGDSKENVIRSLNDDTHTRTIGNTGLVHCTGGVLMEVEDFIDDVHPVRDNEQNDDIYSSLIGIPTTHYDYEERDAVKKASAKKGAERSVDEYNGEAEGIVHLSATKSNDTHINRSENGGEYSNSVDELLKSESAGPSGSTCTSSKPDFSKLKGKICLDSLSVRELQETFRAMFGRETSVKDKQWLKRRISMALSNSCDVLSMTFVIDESNTVKIIQDESARTIEDTLAENLVVREIIENINQSEDPESVSGERLRNSNAGHDSCSEDQQTLGGGAKRARKPTKRYIEELSEIESREGDGNLVSVSKISSHVHSVSKPRVRPEWDTRSVRKPIVTRRDSFGGSGVLVPYVCRIRRSRPRENYVTFMNLQSGCMGITTQPAKEALGSCGPLDDYRESKVFAAVSSDSAWLQKHTMEEPEKERQSQEREICEPEKDEENVEPTVGDSLVENSDKDTPDLETVKVGVKRKHHRPWSLNEVVNLVDGVARFGAGRWSEIKRLSFASHSYRSSVDLKDKWRNLMRASFAHPATEQGNSRKQISAPIPLQILNRVRDLVKMQAQVPPVLNSSKFNGENVHTTNP